MFDNAFAALKGLFSRSFVVSAFLPVFFALALNGLFAALAAGGLPDTIAYLKDKLNIADVATAFGLVTLLAIPLAFALSPLLVSFRLLFEGEGWPETLVKQFSAASRDRSKGAAASAEIANSYAIEYKKILDEAEANIPDAAAVGNATGALASPALIEAAVTAIAAFETASTALPQAPPEAYKHKATAALKTFRDACAALGKALEANASRLPDTAPAADIACALRLSQAFDRFFAAMEEGREAAWRSAARRIARRDALLVANDPRPTRLGNLRAQIEDYCQTVYGVDLDYLWPRLRFGIDHEEEKFEPVEQAETQLAFALMLLLLVMTSGAGWLIYLLYRHDSPILLAIVGLLVPLLSLAFYRVVVASQRLLVTTMKATIDRFRLGLLTALRMPAPTNYAEEREAWKNLEGMSQGIRIGSSFAYAPPPP